MHYKKTQKMVMALLGSALLAASPAFAQQDSNKALLDLLVKKGVLTSQEADGLQQELKASAPAPSEGASASESSTTPVVAAPKANPMAFSIGGAEFTPFGFLDFTAVYRSTLNGGDIGSSFGSIPYGNTASGQLSETRFSAKNSRFGVKVDSTVGDTKVLGYVETDFLGNAATNVNVASNSDVLRMRQYFVDLRRGDFELLAGQAWSLMTPDRKGIAVLPSDLFYTQDVDANYQVGLVWGRTPQIRATYHVSDELSAALSLENPDQYVGSAVTLPSGFTTTQVDNGSNGTATPNVFPDVIGKVALDTKLGDLPFHADVAGMVRYFKINTYTAAESINSSATGFGGEANATLAVLPNLLLIGNGFDGNGAGRYLSTGLGPDFIVNPANSSGAYTLSLVNAYSTLDGAEWDVLPTVKLSGYFGLVHFGQKYDELSNSTYVGYGFPGSATTNNKTIEEYTLCLTHTLWKDPTRGDVKLLYQYSYLDRSPWSVAANTPSKANMNMGYFDIRYDLP